MVTKDTRDVNTSILNQTIAFINKSKRFEKKNEYDQPDET